jgi:beta-lactamase class A
MTVATGRSGAALLAPLLLAFLAAACDGSSSAVLPTITGPTPTPARAPPASEPSPSASPQQPVPTVSLPEIRTFDELTTDVPVPALPASFAAPKQDAALAAVIRTTLAGYEGDYSVVVHNLSDGRYAALNERQVYYAASLFKLALLLEAYRQRDAGQLDFSELLTLTEEYAEYDLNTLEALELEVGDQFTVADALRPMIIVSDTPTAVLIQDTVNPVRAQETLEALGATDMSLLSTDLPTTARDMALLMESVAVGHGVTAESRREMLALLLQESVRDGIPYGVPANTAVAHKSGNYTDATHDVALVWGPAGPYVIAVLSDRYFDSRPIAAVSSAVWDYFGGS